jgi:hypothetical protein
MGVVDDDDTRHVRWKLDLAWPANLKRNAFAVQTGSVELLPETVDPGCIRIDYDYVKLGFRDKRFQQTVLIDPQHKRVAMAIVNSIEDLFAETR